MDNCYDLSMQFQDKEIKDRIKYQTCDELGITYTLTDGEYYTFGCDGHVIDMYPN